MLAPKSFSKLFFFFFLNVFTSTPGCGLSRGGRELPRKVSAARSDRVLGQTSSGVFVVRSRPPTIAAAAQCCVFSARPGFPKRIVDCRRRVSRFSAWKKKSIVSGVVENRKTGFYQRFLGKTGSFQPLRRQSVTDIFVSEV